jgi:hypothetical protein
VNLDFAKRNECGAIHAVSCLARQMPMSSVTEGSLALIAEAQSLLVNPPRKPLTPTQKPREGRKLSS